MAGNDEAIGYRSAQPDEQDALVALWVAANPDTDPAAWAREYARLPDRFEHTLVAVSPLSGLLAAAVWWPRRVRDSAGTAQLVANLSHVATRPEARRQGHATRLIALAVDAMRGAGCVWATLTADEEAQLLYTRLGWRAQPRPLWQGRFTEPAEVASDFVVTSFDPGVSLNGWEPIAQLYDAANTNHPGSVVRPPGYWPVYLGPRAAELYDAHAPLILTATPSGGSGGSKVCGYAWMLLSDPAAPHPPGLRRLVTVVEGGALPGQEGALVSLIEAVKSAAGPDAAGRMFGPATAEMAAAAHALFGPAASAATTADLMVRPLVAGVDAETLDTMYRAPGAVAWPLDDL